jgi:C1A family cysteine protease
MSVVPMIDLTKSLGAVREQGDRPTCMAFAISELHRHGAQAVELFSAEYLYRAAANLMSSWQPYTGLALGSVLKAVNAPGQPCEQDCPYEPNEPDHAPPLMPAVSGQLHTTLATACHVNVDDLTKRVEKGQPVGLVLQLTDTFLLPQGGIVEYSQVVVSTENHAVVAAGFGTHSATNEPHFLVRNTWGPSWGNSGSAWLPARYILDFGLASFEVS